MKELTIRDAVLQALGSAGSAGMLTDDLLEAVERLRGQPVRRVAVSNAIHEMVNHRRAVIAIERRGATRLYTLQGIGTYETAPRRSTCVMPDDPFQAAPALPHPVSITAALFGDPLPGRSALDQRRAAHA